MEPLPRHGSRAEVAASPVVFAVTYEVQQLASRLFEAGRLRGVWPILCALQRAVMEEPDDEQIVVAVLAMREVLALEADVRENSKGDVLRGGCPHRSAPCGAMCAKMTVST